MLRFCYGFTGFCGVVTGFTVFFYVFSRASTSYYFVSRIIIEIERKLLSNEFLIEKLNLFKVEIFRENESDAKFFFLFVRSPKSKVDIHFFLVFFWFRTQRRLTLNVTEPSKARPLQPMDTEFFFFNIFLFKRRCAPLIADDERPSPTSAGSSTTRIDSDRFFIFLLGLGRPFYRSLIGLLAREFHFLFLHKSGPHSLPRCGWWDTFLEVIANVVRGVAESNHLLF